MERLDYYCFARKVKSRSLLQGPKLYNTFRDHNILFSAIAFISGQYKDLNFNLSSVHNNVCLRQDHAILEFMILYMQDNKNTIHDLRTQYHTHSHNQILYCVVVTSFWVLIGLQKTFDPIPSATIKALTTVNLMHNQIRWHDCLYLTISQLLSDKIPHKRKNTLFCPTVSIDAYKQNVYPIRTRTECIHMVLFFLLNEFCHWK